MSLDVSFPAKPLAPTDRIRAGGLGVSELARDQRKPVRMCSFAQFLVPAGDLEVFAGGEGKSTG